MVMKQQNRKLKTTVYLLIDLLLSLFIQFQISLSSHKAYDKFDHNDWKTDRLPVLVGQLSHFSTDRARYQGESAMFSIYACTRAVRAK